MHRLDEPLLTLLHMILLYSIRRTLACNVKTLVDHATTDMSVMAKFLDTVIGTC